MILTFFDVPCGTLRGLKLCKKNNKSKKFAIELLKLGLIVFKAEVTSAHSA